MSESEANPPESAEAMALPPLDDSSPPRARAAKRLVRSERETVETTVVDVAVAPSPYRKGRDEKSTTLAAPAPANDEVGEDDHGYPRPDSFSVDEGSEGDTESEAPDRRSPSAPSRREAARRATSKRQEGWQTVKGKRSSASRRARSTSKNAPPSRKPAEKPSHNAAASPGFSSESSHSSGSKGMSIKVARAKRPSRSRTRSPPRGAPSGVTPADADDTDEEDDVYGDVPPLGVRRGDSDSSSSESSDEEASEDETPTQARTKVIVDKAGTPKAQKEYEDTYKQEYAYIKAWKAEVTRATTLVSHMKRDGHDSSSLQKATEKLDQAIKVFDKARNLERRARLNRYANPQNLSKKKKTQLTKTISGKMEFKAGKRRLANLRLETLQKALEVAHADFLFATPNLQDGGEASALPVAAAAPDEPTPAPATSNRQIGRLARSYADAAQGLASLPPDDPEPNRTTSSLFSSQPDSKMPARAAKPDSKMPARASTSAKRGATNAKLADLTKLGGRGKDENVAETGEPQDVDMADADEDNSSGDETVQTSSRSPPVDATFATARGTSAPARAQVQTTLNRQPAPAATQRSQSTLTGRQPQVRERRMVGEVQDQPAGDAIPFDRAPTQAECDADPTLWGQYIDFLAGRNVNRSGFARFVLVLDILQMPANFRQPGDTNEASVLRYIGAYFNRLEEVTAGRIVLIRFSTRQQAMPLTRPSNFPQQLAAMTLGQARRYFPRVTGEANNNNQIWFDAMLLTDEPNLVVAEARNLHHSRQWAIRATPHSIQDAERAASAGWGLFSADRLSPDALQAKLSLLAGVPIIIKHKRITQTTRNSSVLTLDYRSNFHRAVETQEGKEKHKDLPAADHFMCRPGDRTTVEQTLQQYLRLGGTAELDYRKVRYIPEYDRLNTAAERFFYEKAVSRQRAFKMSAGILVKTGIENMTMEITVNDRTVTLQTICETFPRKDNLDKPLFIRCEKLKGQDGYGFAVAPGDIDEGRDGLEALLPFCRHYCGEDSLQWFTPSEQVLREKDVWDPKIHGVPRNANPSDDIAKIDAQEEEAWELLQDDSDPEESKNSVGVDQVPPPRRSPADIAIQGRSEEDSLESFRHVNTKPRKQRASKEELQSSLAQVDQMLHEVRDGCDSLGVPYDEQSFQTSRSLREKVQLLREMQTDFKREYANVAQRAPAWAEQRANEPPGGEDSGESVSDASDLSLSSLIRGHQVVAQFQQASASASNPPDDTAATVTPNPKSTTTSNPKAHLNTSATHPNISMNPEGPSGRKRPTPSGNQGLDDSQGRNGEAGQPQGRGSSDAACRETGGGRS